MIAITLIALATVDLLVRWKESRICIKSALNIVIFIQAEKPLLYFFIEKPWNWFANMAGNIYQLNHTQSPTQHKNLLWIFAVILMTLELFKVVESRFLKVCFYIATGLLCEIALGFLIYTFFEISPNFEVNFWNTSFAGIILYSIILSAFINTINHFALAYCAIHGVSELYLSMQINK